MKKPKIHYTAPYLLSPTNPITVNVIGAGGTGSKVCGELASMHLALRAFGSPGLQVRVFDKKNVSAPNIVRQLYYRNEIGLPKAECLVARLNRQHSTRWQGFSFHYTEKNINSHPAAVANITISCVDTVAARFEIAQLLSAQQEKCKHTNQYPYYWLDFGNGTHTGQAILSTISTHEQGRSKTHTPTGYLPPVTSEHKALLLEAARTERDVPSCSAAQALQSQDLYINGTLAIAGIGLLYSMLRKAQTSYRGVFVNLHTMSTTPIPI